MLSYASRLSLRTTFLLGLVFVFSLLAVACGASDKQPVQDGSEPISRSPETPIVVPADAPIVIGISTALTGGPNAERGIEYRDAAITAINRWKDANGDLIAGHEVAVHAEDDGCGDSAVTAIAAERLLAVEGLAGVIGPQCSGGAIDVIPTYAEAGVVMISGSATATTLTESQPGDGFFFRTAYRNDLEGTLIGLFLAQNPELGIEHAYLIDNGETYGQDLAENAAAVAEERGATVERRSIVEGTVDFSDLASEIVAANPGFVGYAGFNPEASLLYRQLRDAGYQGLFGAGDGAASVTGFVEPVGDAAEGVLFSGCAFPLPADFISDFHKIHADAPTAAFPAQYADAATVLLNAIAAVAQEESDGSLTIDPIALRDAVRATVLADGLSGAIAFDEHGDRIPPGVASLEQFVNDAIENLDQAGYVDLGLVPCQVQDGRLVNLFGPEAGEIRLP